MADNVMFLSAPPEMIPNTATSDQRVAQPLRIIDNGDGTYSPIALLAANSGVDIGDVDVTSLPANSLVPVTCTIAESGSLSAEIDLGEGRVLCAIDMPADWDAANLTFQASYNTGGTFDNLYDQYGTEKTVTAAADRYIPLDDPAFWLGVRYIKVRSGTSGTAVNQTGARTIYLVTKPV